MSAHPQEDQEDGFISKSQRKRDMDALQELGTELLGLSNDKLAKLDLPEDLVTAVREYKRIPSFGARKRHEQYVGKLMRDVDPEPIRRFLAALKGDSAEHTAWLHQIERWRDRLLADTGDVTLQQFLTDYPGADVQTLRMQIRNARKEQQESKPPKHFRQLFQTIKALIPEPGQD